MKFLILLSLVFMSHNVVAQKHENYQRLVKIIVDSSQLDAFKAALKIGTETAVSIETGVLSYQIYFQKDRPNHITLFETYASIDAYKKHIETPHFKKYKTTVANMVQSLDIVDILPMATISKKKHIKHHQNKLF